MQRLSSRQKQKIYVLMRYNKRYDIYLYICFDGSLIGFINMTKKKKKVKVCSRLDFRYTGVKNVK